MDHVVIDVEIQTPIEELPNGWEDTHLMKVSVACVWEYGTERMRIYGPDDVLHLQARLLKADRISGFNIARFDYPVIWSRSREEWTKCWQDTDWSILRSKTDDILHRIWVELGLNPNNFSNLHKSWGLDAVCKATLGIGKIGYGGDAPKWYQQGQWARVVNYCCDDVALERDLCNFIDKYGYVDNGSRKLLIPKWTLDSYN